MVGGVNGGIEGPAGLYQHLHRQSRFDESNQIPLLEGWSILSLNTGHTLDKAIPVVSAGIRWILSKYSQSKGRIFLIGCSMGSSTIIAAATLFGRDVVAGLCLLCGQGSHHEHLSSRAISETPLLLIHGANDIILPIQSTKMLFQSAIKSGASVDAYILQQSPVAETKTTASNCKASFKNSKKIKNRRESMFDSINVTVPQVSNKKILSYHHMYKERFVVASLIIQWLIQQRQKMSSKGYVRLHGQQRRRIQRVSLGIVSHDGQLKRSYLVERPRGGSVVTESDETTDNDQMHALAESLEWQIHTSSQVKHLLFERRWENCLEYATQLRDLAYKFVPF